eukprot:533137_1
MYSKGSSNNDAEMDKTSMKFKHTILEVLDSENIKVTETTTLTLNDFLLYHSSLVESTTLLNAFLLLIGDFNIFIDTRIKAVNLCYKWMKTYWKTDFQPNVHPIAIILQNIVSMNNYSTIYDQCHDEYTLHEAVSKVTNGMIIDSQCDINKFPTELVQTIIKYFDLTFILLNRIKYLFQQCKNDFVEPETNCIHEHKHDITYDIWKQKPKYIAQQITLQTFEIFKQITPRELIGEAWKSQNNAIIAPNVVALIHQYNNVTIWIQNEILDAKNIKQRAAQIAKFLQISKHLLEMNNFHILSAIFSALNSASIHRLKHAWPKVSDEI